MAYDFTAFKKAKEDAVLWLKKEYSGLNTGRAMPALLDTVQVEAYGSKVNIREVATVSIEDSKTLRVVPWDKSVAKDIDRAIRESNLGLSVSLDGEGLRLSFPELTSERRVMLLKLSKEKLEEARIAVRTEREKNLALMDRLEKEGELSKDDKFRLREQLQKLVDETNATLLELQGKKEKEIGE